LNPKNIFQPWPTVLGGEAETPSPHHEMNQKSSGLAKFSEMLPNVYQPVSVAVESRSRFEVSHFSVRGLDLTSRLLFALSCCCDMKRKVLGRTLDRLDRVRVR
jgi:hypothetical protein